jgi:hypothetical protein
MMNFFHVFYFVVFCNLKKGILGTSEFPKNNEAPAKITVPENIPLVKKAADQCFLCEILDENPLKLAPSREDIDQLLLHHILVKISQLERAQEQH